jgi:hypothetical protein
MNYTTDPDYASIPNRAFDVMDNQGRYIGRQNPALELALSLSGRQRSTASSSRYSAAMMGAPHGHDAAPPHADAGGLPLGEWLAHDEQVVKGKDNRSADALFERTAGDFRPSGVRLDEVLKTAREKRDKVHEIRPSAKAGRSSGLSLGDGLC